MKKIILLAILALSATIYAVSHKDGDYKGTFSDQLIVKFRLKGDIVESAHFTKLLYGGTDFLREEKVEHLRKQYEALLTYAIGKNVDEAIKGMENPGEIERAGATIRARKVRAAMNEALKQESK